MGIDSGDALLERGPDLDLARGLIGRALGGDGAVLALEAPAGTGKTTLLGAACELAVADGMQVLSAAGNELERDLGFGHVRRLLRPAVAGPGDPLLRGPAALAGPVLGLAGEDVAADPSAASLHGLHSLVAALAERAPLLLALDDAHWSDEATLRFAAYLARRAVGLPLLLVVSLRPDEPGRDPVLDALLHEPGVVRHGIRPLSREGTAILVGRRLGAAAPDGLADACHEVTGGNPFLLGELLSMVAGHDVDLAHAGPEVVRDLGPQAVARSALVRLARLPPAAGELARAAAIFPEGAALRHVAALAGLDAGTAAETADLLAESGILRPDRPIAFVHPLVRTSIYQELRTGARGHAHARAARLLLAEDAPAQAVAGHLLHAEPAADPAFTGALREAAQEAMRAGAPEAAVRYLRRALEEPPRRDVRGHVLHELGEAALLHGDADAVRWLREAAAAHTDERDAARSWLEAGRGLATAGRNRDAVRVIDRAIELVGDEDRELALRYEAELLWIAWQHPELKGICDERLARLPELEGATLGEQLLLCLQAGQAMERSEPHERALELARRAFADGALVAGGHRTAPMASFALSVLIATDQLEDALAVTEGSLAVMRRQGASYGIPMHHATAAEIARIQGRLADAEAEALLALETAEAQGPGHIGIEYARGQLADTLLAQGRPDDALAACDGVEPGEWTNLTAIFVAARARVRLAAGHADRACEDALAVGAYADALGTRSSTEAGGWRTVGALALARAQRRDEAIELAEEELALTRRMGARRALGEALHAAALVHGGTRTLPLLEEAVEVLRASPARVATARALADLGGALRRANRRADARGPLREALDLAVHCGAGGIAAFAEEELRATGARPRRLVLSGAEALTPSERRVAGLAAGGLTNRQIAQELFLSPKTVEMHLAASYRKLDVGSRHDLAGALGQRLSEV